MRIETDVDAVMIVKSVVSGSIWCCADRLKLCVWIVIGSCSYTMRRNFGGSERNGNMADEFKADESMADESRVDTGE